MRDAVRLVVAITDAPGMVWGVRLLELLRPTPVQTHLVIGQGVDASLTDRTGMALDQVRALADASYQPHNQAARISSGSFLTAGLVVAPCGTGTLAAIAMGLASNLVTRTADVSIKERRPVVLLVPEEHLSPIHREAVSRLDGLAEVIQAADPGPGGLNGSRPDVDALLWSVLERFPIEPGVASVRGA